MLQKSSKATGYLFLCLALYAIFVKLFSNNVADYDLWGYLSFGRAFWEDGRFLFHDVFSYTPTKPLWVYHEWLTGILFYFINKFSGPAGLQLLRYIVVLITIYLIYLTARKKGGNAVSASISLIPAMFLISVGYIPVRAQIFTYLFFIMTIYILEIARNDQKWSVLWWFLPIQILWCNLHGGFISGLGLIVLYAIGEALSRRKFIPFIKIFFLATLVTLINPYGVEYWGYMFHTISMPRPEIDEWMSVILAIKYNVYLPVMAAFVFLAFLCSFIMLFRRERNLTEIIVVAVTIYLGFKHIRHIVLFGLVLGAYLPAILSAFWKSRCRFLSGRYWISQSLLAILFLSAYCFVQPTLSLRLIPTFALEVTESRFPIGAVIWIKENNFRGNILPNFSWGEFIIWSCYPNCRIAMDGRYETLYQEYVYREYFDFIMGREKWNTFLRKYPHDMVLIRPNVKTYMLMLKESSWQIAYSDQGCVVFIRKELRDSLKRNGNKKLSY